MPRLPALVIVSALCLVAPGRASGDAPEPNTPETPSTTADAEAVGEGESSGEDEVAESPDPGDRRHRHHVRHRHSHRIDFDYGLFSWRNRPGETKVQVLDLPVFSLLDFRRRDPDYSRVELLDVLVITGFESRRTKDRRSIKVLDLPFFTLFEKKSRGDVRSDTKFVDLPLLGSLYRHRVDEDEREVKVLFLFRFVSPRGGTAAEPPTSSP